jgi:hypothetical protein
MAIFDQNNTKKFSSCKFFLIIDHKTLDPELDPDLNMEPDSQLEKMLDQDPH